MVSSIPLPSRPEHPTAVLDKYAGNRLLAALSEQAIALLAPNLRQSTLPQGVVCYGPGDPIDQVYFPRTGMISLLVTTGAGDMVETSSIGREGAVGIQCGNGPCLSFTRALVQIGGNFWVIPAPRFEAATSHSAELRELVFNYTATL